MAVNPYFNNKNYKPTQNLFEDLSDEVIKMNGIDVVYIIKTSDKVDNLFGDNQHGKLKNSFTIEMYLSTAKNFQGDRDVISKFGMEIKDNFSMLVSRRRFREESFKMPDLGGRLYPMNRPMEGDLIYLPLAPASDNLYEIKFVENESMFYQQGDYYTFRIDCELYKYSMETIQTGFTVIDNMEAEFVKQVDVDSDGKTDYIEDKKEVSNNDQLQTESRDILDFSEKDPFSEGNY